MSSNPKKSSSRYPALNPRPRTRPSLVGSSAPEHPAVPVPTPAAEPTTPQPKTVKVMVNGKLKNRATGNHDSGWCCAPVQSQFQKGNKGGPGRPKGSKSQDTLLREELNAKHPVRVGGRDQKVPKRHLLAKLMVNTPLETRKPADLVKLHGEARRLFPEQAIESAAHGGYDPDADRRVLEQVMAHLRFGEPIAEATDPLADLATGGPDLGASEDRDGWDEGDWDAANEENSDD